MRILRVNPLCPAKSGQMEAFLRLRRFYRAMPYC